MSIDREHQWTLRITSFRGTVPWARHFQGVVEKRDTRTTVIYGGPNESPRMPRYEVEFDLTAEQAKALNDEEEVVAAINGYSPFVWREGMTTTRFEDRDVLIAAAVELFRRVAEPGDVLTDDWDDDIIYARIEDAA